MYLIRERGREEFISIIYLSIYLPIVAHTIVETEKFYDLPSSWRTRKAGGVVQSECEA